MDPVTNPGSANSGHSTPPAAPPAMPMPGFAAPAGGAGLPASQPGTPPDTSWLPPAAPSPGGQPGAQGSQAPQPGQPIVPVPAVAEDNDVIEKEWVIKAKKIIEQTRQDPYKQTRELHKYRAEYLKKRYNKIIEPVDE